MTKKKDTRTFTADEIRAMRAAGKDRTDYEAVRNMASRDIQDEDSREEDFDWALTAPGIPAPKKQLTLRIDEDVVNWFKENTGRGYLTRMNAVLKHYADCHKKHG